MQPDTFVGIGLAVLGLGLPAAVALMRLLPRKADLAIMCPIREHEARMGQIEMDVAVLKAATATTNASLVRIESKLDVINDR